MYSYSLDDETFHETFQTIEEAVIEGFELGGEEQEVVYVGENTEPKKVSEYLKKWIIEGLLDSIKQVAFDECGEATEDFLNCKNDMLEDLTEKIKIEIDVWANDYTLQPDFCQVINVKSYTREDLNNLQVSGA